mgnify:CR=1 FL=1
MKSPDRERFRGLRRDGCSRCPAHGTGAEVARAAAVLVPERARTPSDRRSRTSPRRRPACPAPTRARSGRARAGGAGSSGRGCAAGRRGAGAGSATTGGRHGRSAEARPGAAPRRAGRSARANAGTAGRPTVRQPRRAAQRRATRPPAHGGAGSGPDVQGDESFPDQVLPAGQVPDPFLHHHLRRPRGTRVGAARPTGHLRAGETATGSRCASWWFAFLGTASTSRVRSSTAASDSTPLSASTVSNAVSQCS